MGNGGRNPGGGRRSGGAGRPDRRGPGDRPRARARLAIVHEDDDLLVVDKPVGLATAIPGGSKQRTLFDLVKEHVKRRAEGRARVWVVHRLDSEVSGLVVFAKTERAFGWLKEDLRSRRVQRVYLALVEGEFGPEQGGESGGVIRTLLEETPGGDVRIAPDEGGPQTGPRGAPARHGDARHAVTHYRVLGAGSGHALLRVHLETGRKHQIRVHLASIGHPVAGDRRYGATGDPMRRVALHAAELSFAHPRTGQAFRLHSEAPPSFWRAVGLEPERGAENIAPNPPKPARGAREIAGSWDRVAGWYDDLVEDRRNDLHHEVVLPGALRLLEPEPGQRVLDLACGQGVLCRDLAAMGVLVWGVDASAQLIETARRRSGRGIRYAVADAVRLGEVEGRFWPEEGFDAVVCVMALMNIDPLSSVMEGVARLLRPGGRFVAVVLHPVFRSPGRSAWGWEEERGGARQYRRIDSYLSPGREEIVMNPGGAARGARPVVTHTYHRPLQTYVQQFASGGLLVDRLEEWPSHRRSQPGPRAEEENRARREIPMFLGVRAVKAGAGG